MSGILWIFTLPVVLVLIQWQSMNAYAELQDDSLQLNSTKASNIKVELSQSLQSHTSNTTNGEQGDSLQLYNPNTTKAEPKLNLLRTTCKNLKTPPGATVKNGSCNNTYRSKCVFICKVGFSMNRKEGQARNMTRTCLRSGNWSGNSINCTERSTPTMNHPANRKILLPITVVLGSLLLLILIALAIFLPLKRLKSNAGTRRLDTEENIGHANPAYWPGALPDMVSPQVIQQPALALANPIFRPDVTLTLDNANGRPDNFYPDFWDFIGAAGTQSEAENELNKMSSANCSSEPLRTLCSTGEEFSAQGCSNWESMPNESEQVSQFQAMFMVKEDSIDSKTSIKIATIYASRPDPRSDLIYLRFYVYSDNEDSKMRVKLAEEERFPDSRPAREKPFKMHKHSREFTVKLADLEDGWNSDKPDDTQIYRYHEDRGGSQSIDACDFAVKPEDGRDVNGFSCSVKFQQEGDDEEHSFYLNPGFTPLKRQSIRRSSAEAGRSDITTSTARYEGSEHWEHYLSSLGSELVTEEHIYIISPEVGRNWKDLLRGLSMKEKAIENLSLDLKHETINEQCIQGLIKWKERDPQLATIKTLVIALRNVGCFDALRTLQKLQ